MSYKLSLFGDYDCVSSDSSEGGPGASSHLEGRGSSNFSPANSVIAGAHGGSTNENHLAPFKFNIPVNEGFSSSSSKNTSNGKQEKSSQQQDTKPVFFSPLGAPLRRKPVEPTKKAKIAIARYATAEMKRVRKSFMVADACIKLGLKYGNVANGEPMALLKFYDFMIKESWMRWPEAHLNGNEDKFPGLATRIRRAVKMDHNYAAPKCTTTISSPSKKGKSEDGSSDKPDEQNRGNEVALPVSSRKEITTQSSSLLGERKNKLKRVKSQPENSLIKTNPEEDLSLLKSTIEALEEKKSKLELKDTLIKIGLMQDHSATKYVPKTRSPRRKPKSKRRVKNKGDTAAQEGNSITKLVVVPLGLANKNGAIRVYML